MKEVTGTIELASLDPLTYGDTVSFNTAFTGTLLRKGRLYVQVLGSQDGRIVYQWSADRHFTFPLEQQAGLAALGLVFDPSRPADFTASLIYRVDGPQTIIQWLDYVSFQVG